MYELRDHQMRRGWTSQTGGFLVWDSVPAYSLTGFPSYDSSLSARVGIRRRTKLPMTAATNDASKMAILAISWNELAPVSELPTRLASLAEL